MRGLHRLSFSWRRQCSDHKQGSGLRDLLSLYQSPFSQIVRSTTVLSVRKGDEVVVMADGQGTVGSQILKPNIKKLRRMGKGTVIGGFAGSTADALTLFEQLEMKLEAHPGQLSRAAVELAKLWRTDKYLRKLDAVMVVADKTQSLTISGNGDVVEPNDGIVAIGSGGCYALAAARALVDLPDWSAAAIADKAMQIAADCCIYTNDTFTKKSLKAEAAPKEEPLALSEEEWSQ